MLSAPAVHRVGGVERAGRGDPRIVRRRRIHGLGSSEIHHDRKKWERGELLRVRRRAGPVVWGQGDGEKESRRDSA